MCVGLEDVRSIIKSAYFPLITGLLVGVFFSYFARDFNPVIDILRILATIQGSFLAIIISVFLVSSQVTAGEFGPFTLEELDDSSVLDSLIILIVVSILVDITYIFSQKEPIYQINTDLNLTLGVTVGLATICFLSLLPAMRYMSKQADPEKILKQTARDASWEDVNNTTSREVSDFTKEPEVPERSSLLIIEQIMAAANERNDELTIRQSIFYMNEALVNLVQENNSGKKRDYEVILKHWRRCIEIGIEGNQDRIILLVKCHIQLMKSFLKSGVNNQLSPYLKDFEKIQSVCFKNDYNETNLLQTYDRLVTTALNSDASGEVESILSSLLSISEWLVEDKGQYGESPNNPSGEKRDLIASSFTTTVNCLESIAINEKTNREFLRRNSRNTIDGFNLILGKFQKRLDNLEEEGEDIKGIERNVLSEIQESLLIAIESIYERDSLVAKNIAYMVIELSLYQGRDPNQLSSDVRKQVSDSDIFSELLDNIAEDIRTGGPVSASNTFKEVSEEEIENFVKEFYTITTSKQQSV